MSSPVQPDDGNRDERLRYAPRWARGHRPPDNANVPRRRPAGASTPPRRSRRASPRSLPPCCGLSISTRATLPSCGCANRLSRSRYPCSEDGRFAFRPVRAPCSCRGHWRLDCIRVGGADAGIAEPKFAGNDRRWFASDVHTRAGADAAVRQPSERDLSAASRAGGEAYAASHH